MFAGLPATVSARTSVPFTLRAVDSFGQTAIGYRGTVHFSSTDGRAVLPANYAFTAADAGSHGFSPTFGTPGPQTVRAADTTSGPPNSAAALTITSTSSTGLFSSNGNSVYGGSVTFTATVTATAGTVPGGSVTFKDGLTVLATVALDNGGRAAYTTAALTASGSPHTISAVYNPAAGYLPSSASLSEMVNRAALRITADNKSKVAGDPVPTLTATYSGFVNGDSPASLTTPVTLATYTADTAGTYAITASGATSPNYAIAFGNGTLTIAPAVATTLTVTGLPATAGAGTAQDVTVTADDAYGNVATRYLGTVTFSTGPGYAVAPADYTFTATDAGSHTFRGGATFYQSGTQTLTATDTTASFAGGATVLVTPGAAAYFLTSAPSTVTAGDVIGMTLTVYDAYGNVATGYTGTVTLYSTDPQATTVPQYTFTAADAGVFTFTGMQLLFTAGPQSIFPSDGSIGGEADFTVTAGAAVQLVLSGPSSVTAGAAFLVTVTALDAYGNVATGYTGTVTFGSDDLAAVLPADYQLQPGDQGSAAFTLTLNAPGAVHLTVTDTADGSLASSLDLFVS